MQNAAKVEIFQRWNTIYVQSRYNVELNDKVFDSTESNKKSIKIEDLEYILDAGRLDDLSIVI